MFLFQAFPSFEEIMLLGILLPFAVIQHVQKVSFACHSTQGGEHVGRDGRYLGKRIKQS